MHKFRLIYTFNGEKKEAQGERPRVNEDATYILFDFLDRKLPLLDRVQTQKELLKHYGYEALSVYWDEK